MFCKKSELDAKASEINEHPSNSDIKQSIYLNEDQIESKIKFEIKPLHRKIRTMYLRSKQEVTAQAVEQVENKLSNKFNLIDNRIVTNSKGMLKLYRYYR